MDACSVIHTVCLSSPMNINSTVERSARFVICVDILEISAAVFSGDQSLFISAALAKCNAHINVYHVFLRINTCNYIMLISALILYTLIQHVCFTLYRHYNTCKSIMSIWSYRWFYRPIVFNGQAFSSMTLHRVLYQQYYFLSLLSLTILRQSWFVVTRGDVACCMHVVYATSYICYTRELHGAVAICMNNRDCACEVVCSPATFRAVPCAHDSGVANTLSCYNC